MIPWLVSVMIALCPPGRVPSRESAENAAVRYGQIAEDIVATTHRRDEAALILAVAVHESGLRLDVDRGETRGSGLDVCLMQLRGGPPELATNRRACLREGLRRLHKSWISCSGIESGRLAAYASGSCSRGLTESRAMIGLWRRIMGWPVSAS